jgi:hypothetical protein
MTGIRCLLDDVEHFLGDRALGFGKTGGQLLDVLDQQFWVTGFVSYFRKLLDDGGGKRS